MAHRHVQLIIGQILTDEEFRSSFLASPVHTLAALRERGVEITRVEADALMATDRRLWTSGAAWIDDRLQRCRLTPGDPS